MIEPARLKRLLEGIRDQERVNGLTHNFYRYPARFSPTFARAVIETFTQPGDLIYDPFMGGGTSLVESLSLGRNAVGTDISSLAAFISSVKTTMFEDFHLVNVEAWFEDLKPFLTVKYEAPTVKGWMRRDYQRNINSAETWRIRKLLEIALAQIDTLRNLPERQLARCILLRTGQWALDCRAEIPSTRSFQEQIAINAVEMIDAAHEFSLTVREQAPQPWALAIQRSAIGAEEDRQLQKCGRPKLILTSPPYPGLHVLYHRWQVRGRKETPAPFWIAGTLDGNGASYYTFGDRKRAGLSRYFEDVTASFRSVHSIAEDNALIVQMVAFSEPEWQLPRYMDAMSAAGFDEAPICFEEDGTQERVWRTVPGRKWYARQMGETSGSREVVLFHTKS